MCNDAIVIENIVGVIGHANTWINGRSLGERVGSIRSGSMGLSDTCKCCVLSGISLRRTDHLSRGVLQTAVRSCVRSKKLVKGEVISHVGPQRHKKNKYNIKIYNGTCILQLAINIYLIPS